MDPYKNTYYGQHPMECDVIRTAMTGTVMYAHTYTHTHTQDILLHVQLTYSVVLMTGSDKFLYDVVSKHWVHVFLPYRKCYVYAG